MRDARVQRLLFLLRCFICACVLASIAACGARQTAPTEGSPEAKRVVSTAYNQVGTRYRLGGDSPQKGFDCSGLVWWVYRQHGVKVPRITKDQAVAGTLVTKGDPAPGDILVFRTRSAPNGLHTGLYSGNGTFIHSPRKGQRVREEQLDSEHWKKALIGVRRVLL